MPESVSDSVDRGWVPKGIQNLDKKRKNLEALQKHLNLFEFGMDIPNSVVSKMSSNLSATEGKERKHVKRTAADRLKTSFNLCLNNQLYQITNCTK